MSPRKMTLLVLALVLTLTGVVHQATRSSLARSVQEGTTQQVERIAGLFMNQSRLLALEFTNQTTHYARHEPIVRVFSLSDETARRTAAHQAANELNEGLIARAYDRRAALVALLDASGKVIARDLNINALHGEDFKARYQAVAAALAGTANKDIWLFNNRMYRISAAPVRGPDGKVMGVLVVGFEESAQDVRALRDVFGTHLVVFLNKKIYASSFSLGGKESREEQELERALFSGAQLADPVVRDRKQTSVLQVTLAGERFLGVAAPLLGNTSHPEAGFVVLASLDQALAPVQSASRWILLLGVLSALIGAAACVVLSHRFLSTLDNIEQGVTEIINGNHDYIFEKQGNEDFEGLENGLNVMVARLLGRPEPSEAGEAMPSLDMPGGGASSGQGGGGPTSRLSPENQELIREPEERYQRRLYDEYVHAREQTGEGAADLSFESFIMKLKDNEAALCKKYNSRAVRFKVVIKQGQVTLKPVPIP